MNIIPCRFMPYLRWLAAIFLAAYLLGRPFVTATADHDEAARSIEAIRSSTLRTRPIESLRVGQRVLAVNPQIDESDRLARQEPDWSTWLTLSLRMVKADGSDLFIELMRPEGWLASHSYFVYDILDDKDLEASRSQKSTNAFSLAGPRRQLFYAWENASQQAAARNLAIVGLVAYMDLPELDIVGPAFVTSIRGTSHVEDGAGCVITATFKHDSANVFDLVIDDESSGIPVTDRIGTTVNHPFWSVDRQDFVQAGDLAIGETLRTHSNEHRKVMARQPRSSSEAVYNIEVWGEHVYYVGLDGVLVHNVRNYNRVGGTGDNYNERTGQGIYVLRDADGNIRYVGRGDAPERLEAHAQPGSGKEDLKGQILFNNILPEAKAKSLEQELMHMLGGPLSINPTTPLRNKIQGIGEGNPRYIRLEFAAEDELVFEMLRRAGLLGKK